MTRAAASAGVADAGHFRHGCKLTTSDLVFDRAFGNEKAGADECFIADPFVACRIAVLANRRKQGVAGEFRTVLFAALKVGKVACQFVGILANGGRFGSRDIHNSLGQQ